MTEEKKTEVPISRWIRNTANNRVLPWTEKLAGKTGMVECDRKGRVKLENKPVPDRGIFERCELITKELSAVKAENVKLKEENESFRKMHGPLETQLPTAEETVEEAEEEEVDIEIDPFQAKFEKMTTKQVKAYLLNKHGEVAGKTTSKTKLIAKIKELEENAS